MGLRLPARLRAVVSWAALWTLTSAIKVDFNKGDQCTDVLGSYEGHSTTCQTKINKKDASTDLVDVPGGAYSVVAQPQDEKDNGTVVAFYSNPDCTYLIGVSNVPSCVGAGGYKSYKIIKLTDVWLGEYNVQALQIIDRPANGTATIPAGQDGTGTPEESSVASDSSSDSSSVMPMSTTGPSVRPTPMAEKRAERSNGLKKRRQMANLEPAPKPRSTKRRLVEHGAIRRTNTGTYKYQQIAERAWRGVPLSEWDANVHERGFAQASSTRVSRNPSRRVFERDLAPDKCMRVRTCLVDTGKDLGFPIKDIASTLIETITKLNPKGNHYKWLEPGLLLEIENETGGTWKGLAFIQTDRYNPNVKSCSTQNSESDVLESALMTGLDDTDATDLRVDMKLLPLQYGGTISLYVSTRSSNSDDMTIHPWCEAVEINV